MSPIPNEKLPTRVLRALVDEAIARAGDVPLGGKVTRKGLLSWASMIWGDSVDEKIAAAAAARRPE